MTTQKIRKLRQKILASRCRLIEKQPFFAMMLMYVRFVAVPGMKQISTNGLCIFFSPAFLESLGAYELDFILCHQIMHIIRGDIWRHLKFLGDQYHFSCDLLANRDLELCGFEERSCAHFRCIHQETSLESSLFSNHEFCDADPKDLFDSKLQHKRMFDTDEYWDDKTNFGWGGTLILDAAQGGILAFWKRPNVLADRAVQDSSPFSSECNTAAYDCCGNTDLTGGSASEAEYENSVIPITGEELHHLWKSQLIAAAELIKLRQKEYHGRLPGDMPGFLKRLLGKPREPVINWRKALREFIQEETCDYSFCPPDRRYADSAFFLPDYAKAQQQTRNVLFWVDTSGSITDDDLAGTYAEISDALAQFQGCLEGQIGFFDVDVTPPVPFRSVDELMKTTPIGGGGTDFHCIFAYVWEHYRHDPPACMVIFTDGIGPYPAEKAAMGIPVLWLINNRDVTPPFGRTLRVCTDNESDLCH